MSYSQFRVIWQQGSVKGRPPKYKWHGLIGWPLVTSRQGATAVVLAWCHNSNNVMPAESLMYTDRKSNHIITTSVHYIHVGGDNKTAHRSFVYSVNSETWMADASNSCGLEAEPPLLASITLLIAAAVFAAGIGFCSVRLFLVPSHNFGHL